MDEQHEDFETGDIVEFTVNGQRRTAEVMLVTTDDVVLLDLFDGDRPAWARRATLRGRGDLPPRPRRRPRRRLIPATGQCSPRPGHSSVERPRDARAT